jgi:hypothetical protein
MLRRRHGTCAVTLAVVATLAGCGGQSSRTPSTMAAGAVVRLLQAATRSSTFGLHLSSRTTAGGATETSRQDATYVLGQGYSESVAATDSTPGYREIAFGDDVYVKSANLPWTRIVLSQSTFGTLLPQPPGRFLLPFVEHAQTRDDGSAVIRGVRATHYTSVESIQTYAADAAKVTPPGLSGSLQALASATGTVRSDLWIEGSGLPVQVSDTETISVSGQTTTITATRTYTKYNQPVRLKPPAAKAVRRTIHANSPAELQSDLGSLI